MLNFSNKTTLSLPDSGGIVGFQTRLRRAFDYEQALATHLPRFAQLPTIFNLTDFSPRQYFKNYTYGIDFTSFLPPLAMLTESAQQAQDDFKNAPELTNGRLDEVTAHFARIDLFANAVVQSSEVFHDSAFALEPTFRNGIRDVFEPKVAQFGCREWRCAYHPLREHVYAQMQDGFAMWIFAAIWFLITMPIMTASVCIRRRD
jgi:hypothetical protein